MKKSSGLSVLHTSVGVVLIVALIASFRCATQMAGPIEVGNPAVVYGMIVDTDKKAVSGASVFLVTPDYNPVFDNLPSFDSFGTDEVLVGKMIIAGNSNRYTSATSRNGTYAFQGIPRKTYNLFVTDSLNRRLVFRPNISVNQDSVELGSVGLDSICFGEFNINDSLFIAKGYISVLGTPLKQSVDSAGTYLIPLPAANMSVFYISQTGDTVATLIDSKFVNKLQPGDTLDLTGGENVIIPPLLALADAHSGFQYLHSFDTISTDDSSLTVAALGAFSSKGHGLEFQYFVLPDLLSPWSFDSSFTFRVQPKKMYSVTCRVRSNRDYSAISGWIEPKSLFIEPRPINGYFLTIPDAPQIRSRVAFTDTLKLRIRLGGAKLLFGLPVEYRAGWTTTAGDSTPMSTSAWTTDTISYVSIPHSTSDTTLFRFRAQARSIGMATGVDSPWSAETIYQYNP
jgi:hypothetical protein